MHTGHAATRPLGSLDGGSSAPGGPGGAVTDTYATLRFEFPGDVPTARTFRVQVVPTGDVCVSHQNTLDCQQTVPANAAGVTRQDTLAYLRDANRSTRVRGHPVWVPGGSPSPHPEGETDLAITTRSGTTVGVTVK